MIICSVLFLVVDYVIKMWVCVAKWVTTALMPYMSAFYGNSKSSRQCVTLRRLSILFTDDDGIDQVRAFVVSHFKTKNFQLRIVDTYVFARRSTDKLWSGRQQKEAVHCLNGRETCPNLFYECVLPFRYD